MFELPYGAGDYRILSLSTGFAALGDNTTTSLFPSSWNLPAQRWGVGLNWF